MTPEVEQDLRKEIERLKGELAECLPWTPKLLKQYVEDTSDGFECLPGCNSHGHEEMCPRTNAVAAFRQLKRELAEKECTCGSGAHPRRCLRHPQGFDLHVVQLNYEVAQDTIQELEKELEQAERELAEKSEQLDSLISEVTSMKCAHVHPSIRWASKQMWNYVMGRDVSAATVAEVTHAIEAKEAELTRLREALTDAEDFARHDRGCPDYSDEGPCVCGYEQWWTRKESALHPSPSKPEDV